VLGVGLQPGRRNVASEPSVGVVNVTMRKSAAQQRLNPAKWIWSVTATSATTWAWTKHANFAQKLRADISRDMEKSVVRNWTNCSSIDPVPVRWDVGLLAVDKNWTRLACDVTHYGGSCYLTVIDFGPSRFALWRKLRSENASDIVKELELIILKRGGFQELLLDNATSFHSQSLQELYSKWGVLIRFRCAYRPSGNGIIKRHHRTVKTSAARTGKDPREVLM
jgi:transposase InsO family protein